MPTVSIGRGGRQVEDGRAAGQARARRVTKYGAMRFGEYAAEWKAGQRDLGPASVVHLKSLLNIHLLLDAHRLGLFDDNPVAGGK